MNHPIHNNSYFSYFEIHWNDSCAIIEQVSNRDIFNGYKVQILAKYTRNGEKR